MLIYFRYLFGITDHADRNFMIGQDKYFYGVDEENISFDKEANFKKLVKPFKFLLDNWDRDYTIVLLKKWKEFVEGNPTFKDELNKFGVGYYDKFLRRLNKIIKNPESILKL